MTVSRRTIRALREARQRLRDVAAAEHGVTTQAREDAERQLDGARTELQAFLDEAAAVISEIRSVHDLEGIADIVTAHQADIDAAAQHHAQKVAETEASAARLRERTRQLKTAEKLVEVANKQHADHEARTEQRGSDDLSGSRKR